MLCFYLRDRKIKASSLASNTCRIGRNCGKVPYSAAWDKMLVSLREECFPLSESSLACAWLFQASDRYLSSLTRFLCYVKVTEVLFFNPTFNLISEGTACIAYTW